MINLEVPYLQTDTIAVLNQIHSLLNRYRHHSTKYQNYQQQIAHQICLVED